MIHRFVGFEEGNKLYIEHFSLNSIFWLPGINKVRFLTPKWDVKGVLWKLLSNEHGSPIFSFQKWILHKILHRVMKKLGQFTVWFSNYIDLLFSPNKPTIDRDVEIFLPLLSQFFPYMRFFVIRYVYVIMSERQLFILI